MDKILANQILHSQINTIIFDQSQGESFLGRKWLIGKKIKKELDKPEGISHAKMV